MNKLKTWQLLVGLVLVVGGSALFIMGVSGGFGGEKAVLDAEYICKDCEFEYMELTPEGYEKLVADKKSFIVMVDQGGCKTAEKIKEFMKDFATSKGIKVYRIMFEDAKKTSLHESVKYYPSAAVVSKGKVIGWLKADSDDDSDAYNKYDAFEDWIKEYLK